MVRVPVPDDFDRSVVVVTPSERVASAVVGGYDRNADIEVDDPTLARDLQVREDDDGRYVGVHADLADRVADLLGTDADGDAGTCTVEKSDGEVCGRDLPCPYHSDGE